MELSIIFRKKGARGLADPGHIAVYWKETVIDKEVEYFRGLYAITSIEEPKDWNILFNSKLEGKIYNDIMIKQDYLKKKTENKFVGSMRKTQIPYFLKSVKEGQHVDYSFNPDTFNCHNCVTWAVDTLNIFLEERLPRVYQGRIRFIERFLFNEHITKIATTIIDEENIKQELQKNGYHLAVDAQLVEKKAKKDWVIEYEQKEQFYFVVDPNKPCNCLVYLMEESHEANKRLSDNG